VTVVGVVLPSGTWYGDRFTRLGMGLGEFATVRVAAAELPPPGAGFTATRFRFAAVAKSAAVNATLT
jgi:hypothetical protein